jgi:DNA-binding transcriptional LysR family regulator
MAIVPAFPAAVAIAACSDLLARVPQSYLDARPDGLDRRSGVRLRMFDLPVATPTITISQMWHPRFDADPAHRWLRRIVLACCSQRV